MSAKIIHFCRAKENYSSNKLGARIIDSTKSIQQLSHSLNMHSFNEYNMDRDYNRLLKSFDTRKSMFMFPTTMSGYKTGINPVDALYNTLQKILFTQDESNTTYQWIVNLFSNKEWVNKLFSAIDSDCKKLDKFRIDKKISDYKNLNLIKERFLNYRYFFKLMCNRRDCKDL